MVATTLHTDSDSLLCPLHYSLVGHTHQEYHSVCTHSPLPLPPPPGVGQDHLPMALVVQRRSNTAIDVDCTRVEALVPHVHVHVIRTAVEPVVLHVYTVW